MIVAILAITTIFITYWGSRLLGMALDLEKNVAEQAADLEEILVTAKATGDQVTSSSESLAASSEQMTASLEEVAATTGQFADNARSLSDKAQVMGQAGEDISRSVDDGSRSLSEAVEQIRSISSLVYGFKEVIVSLDNRAQEIGRIVDAIKEIANQTNLLALNAAIESARAGEQGKGFAVVAEEVRKLPEQSEKSAEEITALVEATQEHSGKAVLDMEKGVNEVNRNSEAIVGANDILQKIMDKFVDIVKQIEEVAGISQEIGSGSNDLSSVVEEQTATMSTMSAAAADLQEKAHELYDVLNRYDEQKRE